MNGSNGALNTKAKAVHFKAEIELIADLITAVSVERRPDETSRQTEIEDATLAGMPARNTKINWTVARVARRFTAFLSAGHIAEIVYRRKLDEL